MVGAERMVGSEQQMLRTEHMVATGKRLVVIAHGVLVVRSGKVCGTKGRAKSLYGPFLNPTNR